MGDLPILREGLHISVSQIKTYLRCPRQYELHYVRGVEPAFVPAALAFGSAFHTALAFYYRELSYGAAPAVERVIDVFHDSWDRATRGPVPLQSDDDEAVSACAEKGAVMLRAFHAYAAPLPFPEIEAIEMPFSVELWDPELGEVLEERLTGAFDLVIVENERRVVVEHKTSARRYSEDQLRYDLQPTAYRYAARELGLGNAGLRYQVVTKTRAPAVQVEDLQRGEQDEDDFLRTAVGVLRAVDAGAFFPVRGWQCRACPYQAHCLRREDGPGPDLQDQRRPGSANSSSERPWPATRSA